MSRGILPKASVSCTEEELLLRKTERGKLLFTVYKKRRCALYIQNNRLLAASFFSESPSRIGAVYIGKIKNMVKNIDACFVEIADGEICFLSLKDKMTPYLLNRVYDGRLVQGDEVLVQVTKDSHRTKKACVTTQISIFDDYFSLSIGSGKVYFSSKLSMEKKNELKSLLTDKGILRDGTLSQDIAVFMALSEQKAGSEGIVVPRDFKLPPIGCVVRTRAGEESAGSENALLQHLFLLVNQFIRLLYTAKYRNCFSCLREAPEEFEAVFQQFPLNPGSAVGENADPFPDINKANAKVNSGSENPTEAAWDIVTDQPPMREVLERYCREHEINADVRLYEDSAVSLSVLYSIESKLEAALASRVWLRSGGYLVIEPTEALTVIDVNTGKYDAGKNPQETYRRINLEAAEEIALQLQLRNLSGIIVVDFINMQSASYNKELLSYLKTLVMRDRIQTHVVDMTPLGLVEITRKKINRPLREQFQTERIDRKEHIVV